VGPLPRGAAGPGAGSGSTSGSGAAPVHGAAAVHGAAPVHGAGAGSPRASAAGNGNGAGGPGPAAGGAGPRSGADDTAPARPGSGPAAHSAVAPADLVDRVGTAVYGLTSATLAGALRAAVAAVTDSDARPLPTRFSVIAMGRFGGRELGYGSDADVLFVHDPLEGAEPAEASRAALAVADELRRLLAVPSADPPLLIDADLRPEGKSGPLVRSLASYEAYYRRWSLVWERHALLRASPVAGDPGLGRRFVELIDPLRYPAGGLDDEAVREIRRLKARMESERLPRGSDPTTHAKLGRGGLSDVEWTVQLLQLRHAAELPALRTTGTRPALAAARAEGLIGAADAAVLDDAWVLATRVRNAVMLVRGRPGDTFPADPRELAAVGRYLGYPAGHVGDMLEDYRRRTRRARAVVERLFYED
jgi:glutamate-ammonia-ligase adenylyltransferase